MASFWEQVGPGLIGTGFNIYKGRQEEKEAEERLRRSQGPLYDQLQSMAGTSLNLAGGMNPQALATDRFGAQQALLEPGREAQRQQLMRQLAAKGMLGVASHSPVAGTTATPGVAMNPHMAALLAAQEGAKSQAAYQSLGEGEQYLDRLLNRGGMLQRQAQGARATGQQAMTQIPRSPSITQQVLGGLVKDPKIVSAGVDLAGKGFDALRGLFDNFNFQDGTSGWDFASSGWSSDAYGSNDDWLFDI
jgi:hypothetical protein